MKKTVFLLIVLTVLLSASSSEARRLFKEKAYQKAWCESAGGVTEVVLQDKTRVDCVTDEYAVEVDFASKWAEAVGQSLYYAIMTGRRPGILLIMEEKSDERFLERVRAVTERIGVRVWTVTPENGL